ncbi:MAG: hypothetical protein AB8B96_00065 [Lysobacterales bacterium]
MVRDLNPGPEGQLQPFGAVKDGILFFTAFHPDSGLELWASEGTQANTRIAADFAGSESSQAVFHGVYSGSVYFSATDGTGTRELRSIAVPGGQVTDHSGITSVNWLGVLDGNLLVRASTVDNPGEVFWVNNASLPELWVDINETILRSSPSSFIATSTVSALLTANGIRGLAPHRLIGRVATEVRTASDGRVQPKTPYRAVTNGYFFYGSSNEDADSKGNEPWLINNNGGNATLIRDINPGGASSGGVGTTMSLPFNGEVFFAAESPDFGIEVWKSNGAGAQMLDDLAPGEDDSNPFNFMEFNSELYFGTKGRDGPQLWKTDGTGAELVATFDANSAHAAPWMAVVFDDHLIFRVETDNEGLELWATNGQIGQVKIVADINPGPFDGIFRPTTWVLNEDRLLFLADDGANGRELWRLDSGYLSSLFPVFANGFEDDLPLSP